MFGGEIILAVALLLIVFAAGLLIRPTIRTRGQVIKEFQLWVAQGFGVGGIPLAPGTLGSVLGVFWFVALIRTGSAAGLALGILAGFGLSVWWCGSAEEMLGRKDPGSVVLDEIAAMPACFCTWVAVSAHHSGSFPAPADFFSGKNWLITMGIFAAFRLFDVWKPWPARQSQNLPGGWGITVDDFLAAAYVNLVVLLGVGLRALLHR